MEGLSDALIVSLTSGLSGDKMFKLRYILQSRQLHQVKAKLTVASCLDATRSWMECHSVAWLLSSMSSGYLELRK